MPSSPAETRLIARPIHVADLLEGTGAASDIFSEDGHLLIAKGQVVTAEIKIRIARRRGFEMIPLLGKREPAAPPAVQEADDTAAQDLLDSLDDNMAGAIENQRKRLRRRLRAKLEVRPLEPSNRSVVKVWTRDLSEQGIGFISRTEIVADHVEVKLGKLTVTGEIVRRGLLGVRFWEYGVRFLGR